MKQIESPKAEIISFTSSSNNSSVKLLLSKRIKNEAELKTKPENIILKFELALCDIFFTTKSKNKDTIKLVITRTSM